MTDDFPLEHVEEAEAVGESRWHTFVDICINWHMKVGSRISGVLFLLCVINVL